MPKIDPNRFFVKIDIQFCLGKVACSSGYFCHFHKLWPNNRKFTQFGQPVGTHIYILYVRGRNFFAMRMYSVPLIALLRHYLRMAKISATCAKVPTGKLHRPMHFASNR
jgi:hypothetical protein